MNEHIWIPFQIKNAHVDSFGKLPEMLKHSVEGLELVQCCTGRKVFGGVQPWRRTMDRPHWTTPRPLFAWVWGLPPQQAPENLCTQFWTVTLTMAKNMVHSNSMTLASLRIWEKFFWLNSITEDSAKHSEQNLTIGLGLSRSVQRSASSNSPPDGNCLKKIQQISLSTSRLGCPGVTDGHTSAWTYWLLRKLWLAHNSNNRTILGFSSRIPVTVWCEIIKALHWPLPAAFEPTEMQTHVAIPSPWSKKQKPNACLRTPIPGLVPGYQGSETWSFWVRQTTHILNVY